MTATHVEISVERCEETNLSLKLSDANQGPLLDWTSMLRQPMIYYCKRSLGIGVTRSWTKQSMLEFLMVFPGKALVIRRYHWAGTSSLSKPPAPLHHLSSLSTYTYATLSSPVLPPSTLKSSDPSACMSLLRSALLNDNATIAILTTMDMYALTTPILVLAISCHRWGSRNSPRQLPDQNSLLAGVAVTRDHAI